MYCFSKCCRLCLIKNNSLVNITCSGSIGVSFLDKLGLLAPSLVANSRNYISWICEQCRQKLNKAYRFIQNCFKSDAVLDEYCKQLTNADTAQNKCTSSNVSDIQLTENLIQESIPISVKEECLEDLPAIDNEQYYFESTISIEKHEVRPADIEFIKVESTELKQEAYLNIGDDPNDPISTEEIMVSEYDRDQAENVQIDPVAGTSGENNISSCSDVPNVAKDHAESFNISSSNSLTKPESIKSGKRCFKCGICNKTFTESGNLKRHEKLHAGLRLYECKICNKTYTQSGNLRRHEMNHSGARPYECKVCNMSFAYSGNLKVHKRVHTGERPYECDICNKTFNKSSALKQHKSVHSGARPYACKFCDKTFNQSGNLRQHESVHRGERPYQCEICNLRFTQNVHLKVHARLHSGDRPYECKVCDQRFAQSNTRKEHEMLHSNDRPYKCNICNKTFNQTRNLKRHQAIHSNDRS